MKLNSINNYFHFNMVSNPKTNTDFKIMKEKANKAKKYWESLIDPKHYHTFDEKTDPRPMDGKSSYKQIRWNGQNNRLSDNDYRPSAYQNSTAASAYNGWTRKGKELFQKEILLSSLSSGELDDIANLRQEKMEEYLKFDEAKDIIEEVMAEKKAEKKKLKKASAKQRKKVKKDARKFLKGMVKEGRKISREKEKEEYDIRVRAERAAKKKDRKLNQEMSSLFPSDKFEPIVSTEGQLKLMKKMSPRGSPEAEGFSNELKAKEVWNKLSRSKKKSQGGRRTRKKRKRNRTRKRRKRKRKRTRK